MVWLCMPGSPLVLSKSYIFLFSNWHLHHSSIASWGLAFNEGRNCGTQCHKHSGRKVCFCVFPVTLAHTLCSGTFPFPRKLAQPEICSSWDHILSSRGPQFPSSFPWLTHEALRLINSTVLGFPDRELCAQEWVSGWPIRRACTNPADFPVIFLRSWWE